MRRNLVGIGVGVWIGALVAVAMAQEGQTGPQSDPTSSTSPVRRPEGSGYAETGS